MDRSAFARDVAALAAGKRMPEGVYVHVATLPRLPDELQAAVDAARSLATLDEGAFQVVKLATREWKVSLLAYPGFFEEAFPALAESWAVDLATGTVTHRTYPASGNPPILHRKETLLPPDHPRVPELAALTTAAERLGLFADAQEIGTRRVWEGRLTRLGVRVEGHQLVEARKATGDRKDQARAEADQDESHAGPVLRHRTALQRYSLSTPMQALFRHGYLDGRGTVFDYGCGRGDDVRLLEALEVDASGWVPPGEALRRVTGCSARFVHHGGDRCGEDGSLVPPLEPRRILLGQDALPHRVGDRDTPHPENGQHIPCARVDLALRDVLLREIALIFVALHHRLQRAPSRLVQRI